MGRVLYIQIAYPADVVSPIRPPRQTQHSGRPEMPQGEYSGFKYIRRKVMVNWSQRSCCRLQTDTVFPGFCPGRIFF